MSYTIARYALWALLCIPVAVLGFALVGDLLDGILQDAREKKAKNLYRSWSAYPSDISNGPSSATG